MEIYSFTFLDARSLKSRCQQSHAPSVTLGRTHLYLFLASGGGHQALAFLDLQLHHADLCFCYHMVFSLYFRILAWLSSSKDPSRTELGPTLITSY